jgi:hypothetical protein
MPANGNWKNANHISPQEYFGTVNPTIGNEIALIAQAPAMRHATRV